MFWWMRVESLDLNEALRTDKLITTSGFVEVRRVIEEANRALRCIFVQEYFYSLPINKRIIGKLDFFWHYVRG